MTKAEKHADRLRRWTRAERLARKRYVEGYRAAKSGKSMSACAYKSRVAREDWERGFRFGRDGNIRDV